MDRATLRKVQLAMLDIAREIRRICTENAIAYFLDAGTLLGAVRHQGFIPWDDDLDIGMLRAEYDRFIQIAPAALRDDYYLQTWDNDDGYPFPFAKVRKKGTVYVEAVSQYTNSRKELFVDVVAFDELPMDSTLQKKTRRRLYLYFNSLYIQCGMTPWKHHQSRLKQLFASLKYLPFRLAAAVKTREKLRQKCQLAVTEHDGRNTGLVYGSWGANAGRYPAPVIYFAPYTELIFEGELFMAPANYDGVLRCLYGDYMELPPEDRRWNQHQVIEVRL